MLTVSIHPDHPKAEAKFTVEMTGRFGWLSSGTHCLTRAEAEQVIERLKAAYPYRKFRVIPVRNEHPLYLAQKD